MLRSLLGYGLFLAALIAASWYGPRLLTTVSVPNSYNDVHGAIPGTSYRLTVVSGDALETDQAVAWRTGIARVPEAFGYVVARPGQKLSISNHAFFVDGKQTRHNAWVAACDPVVIPAGHVMVVSTRHQYDSVLSGPIPFSRILGRLESFP